MQARVSEAVRARVPVGRAGRAALALRPPARVVTGRRKTDRPRSRLFQRIGMDVGRMMPVGGGDPLGCRQRRALPRRPVRPRARTPWPTCPPAPQRSATCAPRRAVEARAALRCRRVNVAEVSPFVTDAADAVPARLCRPSRRRPARNGPSCTRAITSPPTTAMRRQAGLERLKRTVDYAETAKDVLLLLENTNREPDTARCTTFARRWRRSCGSSSGWTRRASEDGVHRQPRASLPRGREGLRRGDRRAAHRGGAAGRLPRRGTRSTSTPERARWTSPTCSSGWRRAASAATT
jgi:hypothetical protein